MLIISFDAVGDDEFECLTEYPAFSKISKQAEIFRGVPTLFTSNTYPIHASVATGVLPNIHGLTANTEPFPARFPLWHFNETGIHAKTLWQAAYDAGIDTAAIFWPVTAHSKTIRYNIPEVMARPGKNQLATSFWAGSRYLQFKMIKRYGRLLKGISQPERDNFAAACTADILREYKPGLVMVHLTAYDTICHENGKGSETLKTAYEALDNNLALIMDAAGENRETLIFSDHSQLNIHSSLEPNSLLVSEGLLYRENDAYTPGNSGCFIECCGGSAFFHAGSLPAERVDEVRGIIARSEGFNRFLTGEEMLVSGYKDITFGFCAKAGYCYHTYTSDHKAEHGYPPDMPDYNVFYLMRGSGMKPGRVNNGGSLLDIAPMAAKSLGITL